MSQTLAWALVGGAAAAHVGLAVHLTRSWPRRGRSPRLAALTSVAALAGGVCLWLVFRGAGLDLEHHQAVLWALACPFSAGLGFAAAAVSRRLPGAELTVAVLLTVELAAVTIWLGGTATDIAAAHWRVLLVAPAALLLSSFFGASLGFLAFGSGALDAGLGYEAMIGRRFLLARGSVVLSAVTTISVFGVALGVWLVIVALGILGGFEQDLRDKIIGTGAHVVVQQRGAWPVEISSEQLESLRAVRGVEAFAPFVEGEVALASQSNYTGGLLFGIDPQRSPGVLTVLGQVIRGSLAPIADEPAAPESSEGDLPPPMPVPHLVIGREMASMLNVSVGDRVRVISPLLETMTPLGMAPKSVDFRVAAVFSSKMYEFDARFVYTSLPAARRFFELEQDSIVGLHVATRDPDRSEAVGDAVVSALSSAAPVARGWEARDWKSRNQTLFAALKLERVVAFVVLAFIILVASFAIVSTLTMSVIEKRKEIAILKTIGARDVGVMKIFLTQGMLVGTCGTLLGAAGAVLTAILLERIGFGIPGEVYYIDALPVRVGAGDVVLIVFAALLIVWDFVVFPAIRGARLAPVEGLRDG